MQGDKNRADRPGEGQAYRAGGDEQQRILLAFLCQLLERRLNQPGFAWFVSKLTEVSAGDRKGLTTAIGLAPRKLGKHDLVLDADERKEARACAGDIDLDCWSIDQLARVAFFCASWRSDDAAFVAGLTHFAQTAEINELVALYRGFPLYQEAGLLEPLAREAVRSSIKPLFEAVAHRNPYPRDHFDVEAWNQMVVKAVFVDSLLWPILGLETRANTGLTQMLLDLAAERRAAGRTVSPEIWRLIALAPGENGLAQLERIANSADPLEQRAGLLALRYAVPAQSDDPGRAEEWAALAEATAARNQQ